jgi:hypothetical protein
VAARTLGDLVRKLGERVLPEVIPMLEEGLNSDSAQERQGVCIGLSEIIQQTSRDNVLLYMDSILPTVQSALSDPQPEVRAAAALTFDSLHATVGKNCPTPGVPLQHLPLPSLFLTLDLVVVNPYLSSFLHILIVNPYLSSFLHILIVNPYLSSFLTFSLLTLICLTFSVSPSA